MKQRDKIVEEARKRYEYAREVWAPIYERCRADLTFSDPTDPQQWPEKVKRERMHSEGGARPCLVFDQLGQFVRQVINTARRNKPAMKFLPVDDESDPELAEILQGLARQVEYESRAEVAYITALDQATRGGIGYFYLTTEPDKRSKIDGKVCAKIVRVEDFESVLPDPDFKEPDGSDQGWCFLEYSVPNERFEREYPKAAMEDWDSGGWFGKDHVRVCMYYRLVEQDKTVLTLNGQEIAEDDYWAGIQSGEIDPSMLPKATKITGKVCEVHKLTGHEVLESTVFPAEFVPVFPVLGNESWEKGKRKLGGCIRTAKDSQISYNFERNSEFEAVAVGPKAPWIAPVEAIEGHEAKWRMANRGNLAYLPYNSIDEQGNPIQKPDRINPAGIASGWTQLSERSRQDIQSALGMFSASIGDNPNSQSGRAVMALQDKADVGSYHYIDNLALSVGHCGRVLTQVWPVIYDAEQMVRILGEDDESQFIRVDPNAQQGYQEIQTQNGQKQIIINPSIGTYDVRCVVGPAYSTRQVEAAAEIGEIVNGNPQLMAMLGDVWVKMRNFPEADKIAKRFKAMLPPEVQAAEKDEGAQSEIPPEIEQAMQQAGQEIQALRQALQQAQQEMQSGAQAEAMKAQNAQQMELLKRETAIMLAEVNNDAKRDNEELKGMIAMLIQQMQPPPQLASAVSEDMAEDNS